MSARDDGMLRSFALSPEAAGSAPTGGVDGALTLSLAEHGIGFVLPAGSKIEGDLTLPCGALIHGTVHGSVRCLKGSLVMAAGSELAGRAEASLVYLCGRVRSLYEGQPTEVVGQLMVAVSRQATGRAVLHGRQFAIHNAKFAAQLRPLD